MNVALPQTTEPNRKFCSVRGRSNRTFGWIFGKMRHYFSTLAPGRGPFPSKFPKFGLQNLPTLFAVEKWYQVWRQLCIGILQSNSVHWTKGAVEKKSFPLLQALSYAWLAMCDICLGISTIQELSVAKKLSARRLASTALAATSALIIQAECCGPLDDWQLRSFCPVVDVS